MRKDLYKVIVERPRRGGGDAQRPAPPDLEDSPARESLRARHRHRKWLNENLAPLRRYLHAQVGRPWDAVFAELCAGIDRRNTVQQHIHLHIEDFVATRTRRVDGVLYYHQDWNGPTPLDEGLGRSRSLYVDPDTGLLRRYEAVAARRRIERAAHREAMARARSDAREDRRVLDDDTQLHRIDGVWYRVQLRALATACAGERDALRNVPALECPRGHDGRDRSGRALRANLTLFGRADVYAAQKRQLCKRELRRHGLADTPEFSS